MILRLACFAMGTRCELVLVGDDERLLRAAGEAALFELEECDRRLSLFRRDSLLSHLNRCAAAGPVCVDTDTFALLEACVEVHRASHGAFDPSVGPLMEAFGFRDAEHGDGGERAAALARVGLAALRLDPDRHSVRYTRPGLQLDLGAIAKGHALDLAARALREAGVECALLHGGTSSAVALDAPPGATAWRVAVTSEPGAPVVHLVHAALGVSSPAGRTVEHGGERQGHVLDPRTGTSARALRHAAVIAPDATRADAWSTALVAGACPTHVPAHAELLLARERAGDAAHDAGAPGRWGRPADVAAGRAAVPLHDHAASPWAHFPPAVGPSRVVSPETVLQDTSP